MTELRTERLGLRPIVEEDLERLIDLDRDPEVVRYASPEFIDEPPTEATHRPWLDDILAGHAKGHRWWAAFEDDEFVGWFFVREGEFGYRLKRSAWGRGLATEGGRAVLANAPRPLHADAVAENTASIRVLSKLGFVQTGEAEWKGMRDLHFELQR